MLLVPFSRFEHSRVVLFSRLGAASCQGRAINLRISWSREIRIVHSHLPDHIPKHDFGIMLHPPSLLESCLNVFKQGRRRSILVIVVVGLVICATLVRRQASSEVQRPYEDRERPLLWKGNASQDWDFRRDAKRLVLDGQECEGFFPGLFQEVDRMVRSRVKKHVTLKELDAVKLLNGNIRVMLYDQEVNDTVQASYRQSLSTQTVVCHCGRGRHLLSWPRHSSRNTPRRQLLTRASTEH